MLLYEFDGALGVVPTSKIREALKKDLKDIYDDFKVDMELGTFNGFDDWFEKTINITTTFD